MFQHHARFAHPAVDDVVVGVRLIAQREMCRVGGISLPGVEAILLVGSEEYNAVLQLLR